MSKESDTKAPPKVETEKVLQPSVGVIVVGNDPEICAGVANLIRSGLAHYGGIETVPMERLVDANNFLDMTHSDTEYCLEEAESMWCRMQRERPELGKLVIPIEIHEGGATGKESVLIEGAIITKDLKLVTSAKYTRTDS